jgi:hypothetical protein
MGLLDKVKEKAVELKEATGGALSDAAMSKVHDVVAAFNAGLPLLREAGCAPTRVDVVVGLPPKIVSHFDPNDVSQETIARITAENPDKVLACGILKALASGARLQKALPVGQLRASTLAVEIGLALGLELRFESA